MAASIHPYVPNALSLSPLDRAGELRTQAAWIDAALRGEGLLAPVWRARNLMRRAADAPVHAVLVPSRGLAAQLEAAPWCFLGKLGERPVFAADFSYHDDPAALAAALDDEGAAPDGAAFEDLRRLGGAVEAGDAAIMAHARGMMHWRLRHRFCGVCGALCHAASAGHVMKCTGCGAQHFPRTDPAVIMLVTHQGRALLGHPGAFPQFRMFTTLAGFVEPGESLEEAVAREVFEETGVRVANVRYRSSQPWPFPSSLMVGFTAEALGDELRVDRDELLDAGWFTREQLRAPEGFVLPPRFSVARRLIDEWINDPLSV